MAASPNMLRAALWYARRGLHVFQVAADCRTPLTGPGFSHGVHDATADAYEIERRFELHPQANLALACGPTSGVFVLDIDVKGEDGRTTLAELEDENGFLPETWSAATPSGGSHLFFRMPSGRALRNRVGFVPGLDVRAAGGSVALAPSRRKDGCYTWAVRPVDAPLAEAPNWLLTLIDPPERERAARPPVRVDDRDRLAKYAACALDAEYNAVAGMGRNTGRNLRLFQAAAKLGELIAAGLLPEDLVVDVLESAADACGLRQEDGARAIAATIRSGLARGLQRPRRVA